jgi:hypothetical protein
MKRYGLLIFGMVVAFVLTGFHGVFAENGSNAFVKVKINEVKWWTYNIQNVNTARQRNALVGTHFDLYVLEPVVTERGGGGILTYPA